MILELVRNPDILFEMGKKKDKQLLIGFAAETNDIKENALKKLEKKNLDIIVANNASTMGTDSNTVEIIKKDKSSVEIKQKNKMARGVKVIEISVTDMEKIKIPLPPLPVQEYIVSILDKFDILVNDLSQGLPKEIELRQKQYEYYREKLLNFEK